MAIPRTQKLIQTKPVWDLNNNGIDVNRWSQIHPRFTEHHGCIVDLGCLGWNEDFEDKTTGNWSGFFFGKKRVIGVDPQETSNPRAEMFRGFVSNFSGRANLVSTGAGAQMMQTSDGFYQVLSWKDFKKQFGINSISILKINIEGAEWDLLDSFDESDFSEIDQICISFHDWLPNYSNIRMKERTINTINKIISNRFLMTDLGIYGWKHFLKY
jgi:hypothetical protein